MGTLQNQDKLRLGFLGGTFDPPHNGHLEIAKLAIEEANLSKLLLCPAFHAPLRDAKSHSVPNIDWAWSQRSAKNILRWKFLTER